MRDAVTIQRDMHDYLPRYYGDIPVASNVVDRGASETAQLNAAMYDVLAQMYVDTATWGLARWERIFNLATDVSKPIDQRRSVIKSRARGAGTVTKALIKEVAESFQNGEVEVTEYNRNYFRRNFEAWTKHANAAIIGDYELRLTATAANQASTFDRALIPGEQYTFFIERNEGTVWIDSYNSGGAKTSLDGLTWDSVETYTWNEVEPLTFNELSGSLSGVGGVKTFVVPSDSVRVRVSFVSLDNATTGVYTFKNAMLMRGTATALPRKFEPYKPNWVGILFVSSRGVPANISDVQTAIREIIPAHIAIDYTFVYTQLGGLTGATFGGIETAALRFDELETWEVT
ncbi:hypothetical protein BK120_08390 [Paenibacillus sp. FSL A5-0031]|uniref:putative phage tail protein n=1 Tax=Paenibacillus sp. FSL A5-0031 TaxID=1920420 RepID=UPI00096D7065|nr:putative phage tail protein [Paenibacillus sp. FSL A5-0031]OME86932.1 hypothetical protein BK120_08390 [Paenibacillus sp. FSL A5-0031]